MSGPRGKIPTVDDWSKESSFGVCPVCGLPGEEKGVNGTSHFFMCVDRNCKSYYPKKYPDGRVDKRHAILQTRWGDEEPDLPKQRGLHDV